MVKKRQNGRGERRTDYLPNLGGRLGVRSHEFREKEKFACLRAVRENKKKEKVGVAPSGGEFRLVGGLDRGGKSDEALKKRRKRNGIDIKRHEKAKESYHVKTFIDKTP